MTDEEWTNEELAELLSDCMDRCDGCPLWTGIECVRGKVVDALRGRRNEQNI